MSEEQQITPAENPISYRPQNEAEEAAGMLTVFYKGKPLNIHFSATLLEADDFMKKTLPGMIRKEINRARSENY